MTAIASRLQQALAIHQQGRLAEAEGLYRDILQDQYDLFDGWHLLGVVKFQQGLFEEAVGLFETSIKLNNLSAPAYSNLGNALLQLQRQQDALEAYRNAVRIQPDYATGHFNLGSLLATLHLIEEALASYNQAISLDPQHISALQNRGLIYLGRKDYAQAIADFNQILSITPGHADSLLNRGLAYYESGQYIAAIQNYSELLKTQPGNVDVHCYQGMAFYKLGMYEQAVSSYGNGLLIDNKSAKTLNNRGAALHRLAQYEGALSNYDRAILLQPGYAEAYSNRGALLHEMTKYEDALASHDQALAIDPQYASAHCNRGMVLLDMLRHEEALESYDKALAINPDYAEAHWNQSLCRLRMGDFKKGWEQYEWRWKIDSVAPLKRQFAQPNWLGEEPIAGKTILLHADQGLGDTIQFCRYAQILAAQDATVLLEVPLALKSLLHDLSGVHQLIGAGEPLPEFDMHCQIMSLPFACKTLADSIPCAIPYIFAQQQYVEKWASRFEAKKGLRIGIAWAGSSAHANDNNRSVALEKLQPLLTLNHQIFSLQKELRPADADFLHSTGVTHWGEELQDFSDTAGIIQSLDLVISVDTSVAHLAGAMGKQVWIMLPYSPDWRWPVDRDTSLWYPTATLLRQPAVGDWDSVINTMTAALASLETEPD